MNPEHPKVSICVSAENTHPLREGPLRERRFEAILGQSWQDWELIIADPPSGAEAGRYFQALAQRDSRVRIVQAPRSGEEENWNHCLGRARGRYVYLATGEDAMAPDCLEKLAGALDRHPDCELAHCPFKTFDEQGGETDAGWWTDSAFVVSGRELARHPHLRRAPFDGFLHLTGRSVYWSFAQLLIRRSLLDKIGSFESRWGTAGRFHWAMRASLLAHTVHVPDTWGGSRLRSEGKTASLGPDSPQGGRRLEEMIDHAIAAAAPRLPKPVLSLLESSWRSYLRSKQGFCDDLKRQSTPLRQMTCLARALAGGNRAAWHVLRSRLAGNADRTAEPADLIQSRLERCGLTNLLVRLPVSRAAWGMGSERAERPVRAEPSAFHQQKKPRVLYISSVPSHPPTAGNRQRVMSLCEQMEALGYDFHLFVFAQEPGDAEAMRARWGDERFTHFPWPCPGQPPPLWRSIRDRVLECTRVEKFHPKDIDTYRNIPLAAAILRTARLVQPDCVLVMYAFHSWIFDLFPQGVRKVVLTEDVLTDRYVRFLEVGAKPEWFSTTRAQERKGLERADCIIPVQEREARFFRGFCTRPVLTVGSLVPHEILPEEANGPPTVLFVGSDNGINRDAVQFCFAEVWPRLRQLVPNARLRMVGPICSSVAAAPPGVELCGTVPDIRSAYMKAHVVICPLRLGTGLKVKCIEALGYGKPLVTTRSGAEGLEEGMGAAFLVAEDANGLAENSATLLNDSARRRTLSLAAGAFIASWNQRFKQAFVHAITGES